MAKTATLRSAPPASLRPPSRHTPSSWKTIFRISSDISPLPSSLPDEVGTTLTDHESGQVGVPSNNHWHHRGISHPESWDSAHLEAGIDHPGSFLGPGHPAGPSPVVVAVVGPPGVSGP